MTQIIVDDKKIELDDNEWAFFKKYIIEDALSFQNTVLNDLGDFAPDVVNEIFDNNEDLSDFVKHKTLFAKLKELDINVHNLER